MRTVVKIKAAAPALVNVEAERVVIGKVLADDRVWFDVADKLTADDFGDARHALIWRGMAALVTQGRAITRPALLGQIGDIEPIDDVNVAGYLIGSAAEALKPEYARLPVWHFADVVLHRAGCRHLIGAADEIKARANSAALDTPLEDIRNQARALIADNDNAVGEAQKFGDLLGAVIARADEAARAGTPLGLRSGLRAFDELVGPLLPGRVIVIGGETSSGKTALAVELAVLLGRRGSASHIAELEMEAPEIAARVLAQAAQVSSERVIDGDVSPSDLDKLMAAGAGLIGLPIWIDARPRQSVGTIQARVARAQAQHGVKLAIIDHLQYVRTDNPRAEEREQIRQVIDDLKAMAKRLQLPVIVVSHVSRQTDFSQINVAADIKRPTLASLYGSSAIEKAADAVVFVHRPIWFLERATPAGKHKAQHEADCQRWRGKAELVLPKRRAGKGYGVRECQFSDAYTWFSDEDDIEL